jgi:hypothetical protein
MKIKREKLIATLVGVGRAERRLKTRSNDELVKELNSEEVQRALAAVRAQKELRARRIAEATKARLEAEKAEAFRLRRIQKPLARIGPTPEMVKAHNLRVQIANAETDRRKAVAMWIETGDLCWAARANECRNKRQDHERKLVKEVTA